MTGLFEYPSYEKLKQCAENPYDLTCEGIDPERIDTFVSQSCGWKLLFATERVDLEVMDALASLATEANCLDKMHRMQAGEIMNCIEGYASENRPVQHTATRDVFQHHNSAEPAAEHARLAKAELDKLQQFCREIEQQQKWTDLVMIGIGGSDLGPRALYLALQNLKRPGRNVHFISNVDPDDTTLVLRGLPLENTLVVVVSKSGTTLETLTNEEFVKARFTAQGLDPKEHFIAVTGEKSPMDDPEKYLKSFYIWDWVGGRYSGTSMVGGVMLGFAYGYDVFLEILRGAHAMDLAALEEDLNANLPLLAALLGVWNHNFLGFPTLAVIPYSQALSRFPAHIQQLDMESNGKLVSKDGAFVTYQTGPVIWGEPGTNAQHSFFQLIHQGTQIVPVAFVGFLHSQCGEDFSFKGTTSQEKLLSNLLAQSLALATGKQDDNPNRYFTGNRPSQILIAEKLTPYHLGALLSFFEHKVAFQGFLWNINSFDQEGVQLGKVLAGRFIDLFAWRKGAGDAIAFPLGEALLNQLEDL